MSEYTYYLFDDRLPARRKGFNAPQVYGGTKGGGWKSYLDIERFDTVSVVITKEEFDDLFKLRKDSIQLGNPYQS